jgi:hypothetical protein
MLGPGVVQGVGSDGVLTIHFTDDGSTRRIVDGYAPMVKLASPPTSGDDDDDPF